MMRSIIGVAVLILLLGASGAPAADLTLKGDQFWAVLNSAKDSDEAVGAASTFGAKFKVVHAVNGWFAAIAGPYTVPTGTGRTFLDTQIKDHGFPKDAYLSRGASFDSVAWTEPPSHVEATLSYDGEHDATMRKGNLELKLTRQPVDKDSFAAVAIGTYNGREAFKMVMAENSSEKPASQVTLVRLDPATASPQVVFTYFWQGAHCCTVTKIATLGTDGSWHAIDGDTLDSDGYVFQDLDDSGSSELVSVDQNFLYAFASFAGSFAPLRIHRLTGDKLEDVTKEMRFRHPLLQNLYRQMKLFEDEDQDAEKNGYYADWIASSLLVGRGDEAWEKMLASYDHHSDFGPDKCTVNVPDDKCPDDKKVKLAFPFALRKFLVDHGYIDVGDESRFRVPYEIEPDQGSVHDGNNPITVPANVPSQLRTCSNAAETVRKLVYQAFAGREMEAGESYDAVNLQGDTTLEGYDANLQKATCAVTYNFSLRPLIGRLAQDGDLRRADALFRLSRRSGGTATHRVKYTVKPTATAGTSYVELLP